MALDGIVDVHITSGGVNGDVFCEFIENLLPQLLPFNGSNGRSVVVMDNASIHHTERATALIEEIGAIPIFLPPYSPDVMPIEECFSKVKSFLRANDPLIQILRESEIEDIILAAFASITPDDCYSWVEHCGYT
jgi:transposase